MLRRPSAPAPTEREPLAPVCSIAPQPMEACQGLRRVNGSEGGLEFNPTEDYMVLSHSQAAAVGVLCLLLGLLSALENAAVLGLIVSSRRLRGKPSYLFLGSLATADFLASLVFAYNFVIFHVFHGKDSITGFLLKIGSVTLAFTASVGSLLLTAADRYLCLLYPPAYKTLLTRGRARVALGVLWALSALISFLPLMGWTCCPKPCSELFPLIPNDYLVGWLLLISLLFAGIVYTYGCVLWKAHQHTASLAGHQGRQVPGAARMRLDVRLAKTLGLVLAVLLACWLPSLVLMAYSVVAPLSRRDKEAFAFCCMLCLVNSMVNPVIYGLRSGEIRSSAHRRLARCRKLLWDRDLQGKEEARSSSTETEAEGKFTSDHTPESYAAPTD